MIVSHQGEIVAAKITADNVDYREPVCELVKNLTNSLYGDKGYISQSLMNDLMKLGVTFITSIRKKMKTSTYLRSGIR
ncbi:hypothetical protein EAE90_18495 [Photorhabdus caribbeanensis]|nr:hypothetical protein [Photorhabdus caribbeanensis]